jgi:hypothetical protein
LARFLEEWTTGGLLVGRLFALDQAQDLAGIQTGKTAERQEVG